MPEASIDPASRVLRFGAFEFETRGGTLRKGGKPVPLQPQPARILAVLISRPGEVVTRHELRHTIWDEHTFVDFEHSLNFCVRQIRKALRDNAEVPRFVETLSRRGYRFIAAVERVPAETSEPSVRSLAVLPLENLSEDPTQEYFADGMTDELITALAKFGALRVISRTSVQRYKRVRRPLTEIARKLNVDVVVEGTVMRQENRVRITAQLIDPRLEAHLWAESYERSLGDVLQLQSEVAQAIASRIHVRLTEEEQSRLKTTNRIDPAAHDCYLRGRYFWNKRTDDNLARARDYFEQAIEKAPSYANAYSGLADTYFYRGYTFGRMAPKEAMPKAKAAALEALALDNGLSEAHTSLGLVKMFFEWDWQGAESEFITAIRSNPNYATSHHAHAAVLTVTGRRVEAVAASRRALEIDPLSIPINNITGMMLAFAGEWDEAIEQYQKTIEMDPSVWLGHWNLALALEETGNPDESVAEFLKASQCSGADDTVLTEMRGAYEAGGVRAFQRKQLEADLRRWNGWHLDAFHIAAQHARLGEADEALAWLKRTYGARSGAIVWMKSYPYFKNLYADPRFEELVRRVGLPG